MRLFCFGFGYSAEGLAHHLSARDITIAGTRTSLPDELPLRGLQLAEWQGEKTSTEVQALLQGSTHVLVSIPPDLEGDVVLHHHRQDLAALPDLAWIGYLSTVGVYGDWHGEWVDEMSIARPINERSLLRLKAERAWLEFGAETGKRVEIFRLVRHLRTRSQRDRQPARGHGAAHRQAGPGVQPHPRGRHRPRAGGNHRQGYRAPRL